MPDSRIKDLPALPAVATSDFVPIDSLAGTRRTTVEEILALGGGAPVFYLANAGNTPFAIPARAPLIFVASDNGAGNIDITLPPNPSPGDLVRVKDVGSGRFVGLTNVFPAAGTIDGSAQFPSGPVIVGAQYQSRTFMFVPAPEGVGGVAEWVVVSDYGGNRGGPGLG